MKIFFITVNYFSSELIKKLINSISENNQSDYHLIIINNSPEDISIHQVIYDQNWITILEPQDNLGFGVGCNLGINYVYNLDKNLL